jgi:hypothetical protein
MSATSLAIALIASCADGRSPHSERETKRDSRRQTFTGLMEQLGGPAVSVHADDDCKAYSVARIRRPPHDSYLPLEGCGVITRETTHYVYRDENGRTLVAGFEMVLPPERVRIVLDSLRDVMTQRFGRPTICLEHASSVAPLYAWDLDGLELTVWADSGLTYFRAGLEARASERICDPPVRQPSRE